MWPTVVLLCLLILVMWGYTMRPQEVVLTSSWVGSPSYPDRAKSEVHFLDKLLLACPDIAPVRFCKFLTSVGPIISGFDIPMFASPMQ